jgi:hypothetical protein
MVGLRKKLKKIVDLKYLVGYFLIQIETLSRLEWLWPVGNSPSTPPKGLSPVGLLQCRRGAVFFLKVSNKNDEGIVV